MWLRTAEAQPPLTAASFTETHVHFSAEVPSLASGLLVDGNLSRCSIADLRTNGDEVFRAVSSAARDHRPRLKSGAQGTTKRSRLAANLHSSRVGERITALRRSQRFTRNLR